MCGIEGEREEEENNKEADTSSSAAMADKKRERGAWSCLWLKETTFYYIFDK